MRTRKMGALEVSELGFGILSFASTYGQAPDKAESLRGVAIVAFGAASKNTPRAA
jgi:aryl-alcohol dehydrogenase-like predicted oxidoreductase